MLSSLVAKKLTRGCCLWISIPKSWRSSALYQQSSGAVWESRWPSWAFRPNEPYGFCHGQSNIEPCLGTGHSLSLICQLTSEDMKLYIIVISLSLYQCERVRDTHVYMYTISTRARAHIWSFCVKNRAVRKVTCTCTMIFIYRILLIYSLKRWNSGPGRRTAHHHVRDRYESSSATTTRLDS